jgi:spore germination protein YaaH
LIVRWQKEQEYFIVRLYQDLVGDWILSQSWGDRAANEATVTHTVLHSYKEARRLLSSIARQQRKRGYRHTGQSEEQLGFDFNR